MKKSEEKITYVKPQILDLGQVTSAFGGDCSGVGTSATGVCVGDGKDATGACSTYGDGFPYM